MFKKVFWLFVLIFFASNICTAKSNNTNLYDSIIQKDKIIVGISFDSKPFGFKDNKGQIKGMEADLAREIARRILGNTNKASFKNVTSQGRINAVTSDEVDMVISTMTITPKRKKIINFSDPYFVAGQAICVRKDRKIDSIDDLMNKKIIVILGTTGEQNIKHLAPNALIQGYVNNSEAIDAFKEGSCDAITTDDALLQGLVMENMDYMLLPRRLTKEPYGIAFKKSKQTESLRKHINNIIKEMKLDGTLQSIKDKWIVY